MLAELRRDLLTHIAPEPLGHEVPLTGGVSALLDGDGIEKGLPKGLELLFELCGGWQGELLL